jgi:lysozyme family protein
MANFNIAFESTSGLEGGWNIDNGGQTYKGISRKGWPNWIGWKLIDQLIARNGKPKKGQFFESPELDNMVVSFYKKNYWDRIAGDYINNQTVANFLYDFYVNSNSALIQVNKGLGARAGRFINEDSLKIINERPAMAYQVMYNLRKQHYTRLAAKPSLKKYAAGWFSRLNSFPNQINA